jgi:hypothetical protein
MLYKILNGHGVTKVSSRELVLLGSSIDLLERFDARFVFTDRHANSAFARFFSNRSDLHHIDWDILQRSDFKNDPVRDNSKIDRYMAELLVYRHVPLQAIGAVICSCEPTRIQVESLCRDHQLPLTTLTREQFFFAG